MFRAMCERAQVMSICAGQVRPGRSNRPDIIGLKTDHKARQGAIEAMISRSHGPGDFRQQPAEWRARHVAMNSKGARARRSPSSATCQTGHSIADYAAAISSAPAPRCMPQSGYRFPSINPSLVAFRSKTETPLNRFQVTRAVIRRFGSCAKL